MGDKNERQFRSTTKLNTWKSENLMKNTNMIQYNWGVHNYVKDSEEKFPIHFIAKFTSQL